MARLESGGTGGGGGGTIGGGGTDNYIPVFAGSTDIEDSNLILTAASTISNDNLHTLTAVTTSFIYGGSNVVNTVTLSAIFGSVNTVTGNNELVAGGNHTIVLGDYNTLLGYGHTNTAGGSNLLVNESNTNTVGNYSIIGGTGNTNSGSRNIIVARSTPVTGNENAVFGRTHVAVTGARNIVGGNNHNIEGSFNIFTGENHSATGASADYNAVFGVSNTIGNGDYNIVGGRTHSLDGLQRSLVAGESHTASSMEYALVTGLGHAMASTMQYIGVVGNQHNIDASYSFSHGQYARNYIYGSHTHTGGRHFENGDAQTTVATLLKATSDDTATELALDSGTLYLSTKNYRAYSYKVTIVGKEIGSTNYAVYKFEFGAVREANAASFAINGLIKTTIHETVAAWDANVTADTTNGRPAIKVTGVAATNIRWTARVEIVEVGTVTA